MRLPVEDEKEAECHNIVPTRGVVPVIIEARYQTVCGSSGGSTSDSNQRMISIKLRGD